MPSELLTAREGATLILTLSDPATRNTLSPQVYTAGVEALNVAESDDSVRAVILRGDGEHFCAGGDLNRIIGLRKTGPQAQSDEDLMTAAKQRGTTTFHLMGTCRMAPDNDPTAVVDDQLRVRGIEGLRVVDASIMPTMPSANLNASVLMIAEKAADLIRGRTPLEAASLKD